MLSDDKIKERVKQEFKTKTISDATESNNSTQEKGTRRSVIVGNPYFDNSIINDKFPIPDEYEMTEEILYNGNDNFRNIGRLLLDKDKNALTSKESKLFSMKEKGFDSVVTINMNNINNELEKISVVIFLILVLHPNIKISTNSNMAGSPSYYYSNNTKELQKKIDDEIKKKKERDAIEKDIEEIKKIKKLEDDTDKKENDHKVKNDEYVETRRKSEEIIKDLDNKLKQTNDEKTNKKII